MIDSVDFSDRLSDTPNCVELPHYCLGAGLARMELQVAIGTLVARLPGLRLAVDPDELSWRTDSIQRGPAALPVTAPTAGATA